MAETHAPPTPFTLAAPQGEALPLGDLGFEGDVSQMSRGAPGKTGTHRGPAGTPPPAAVQPTSRKAGCTFPSRTRVPKTAARRQSSSHLAQKWERTEGRERGPGAD